MKGQFPKAYLRMDPDIDSKHPDNLAEFIRIMCAANRQPWRGRFRSRVVVEAIVGKGAAKRAIDRGDLTPAGQHECADCPPGEAKGDELYLAGWDTWQEGDHTVADRMRAYRNRNGDRNGAVTSTVTPSVTAPSPASETVDSRQQTVLTEPTPEPPYPPPDDLEVLADGLLGHPATPNQLRAIRGLSRKVGPPRAIEVMRHWLTQKADDPFGAVLDQLGTESKSKPKSSEWAYMDAES